MLDALPFSPSLRLVRPRTNCQSSTRLQSCICNEVSKPCLAYTETEDSSSRLRMILVGDLGVKPNIAADNSDHRSTPQGNTTLLASGYADSVARVPRGNRSESARVILDPQTMTNAASGCENQKDNKQNAKNRSAHELFEGVSHFVQRSGSGTLGQ